MKKLIQTLSLIITVGILIWLQREFFPRIVDNSTVTIDTVYEYIHIRDTIYKTKLVPYKVEIPGDTIYVTEDCDSLKVSFIALSKEYRTKRTYKEDYQFKEYGKVTTHSLVTQNSLLEQGVIFDIIIPEKTITITKFEPALYIGGEIGIENISLYANYSTAKFNYTGRYNFIENSVHLGVGYNLKRIKLW